MKKLCFIVGNPHAFHGFFNGQLKYLSSCFEVIGISNEGDWIKKTEDAEGIKIYKNKIERQISPIQDLISILSTTKLLKRISPDIIHANTPKVGLVSMLSGFLARIKTRIYMCHGLRYQSSSGMMRKILMQCEKLTCRMATHVVCVSKGVRNSLIKDGISKDKKLFVVNSGSVNGINSDLFEYKLADGTKREIAQKYNLPDNGFIFCFIGRIVRDKGINELVVAFIKIVSQFPNAHLLIVGDFEDKIDPVNNIKEYIANCKNIHLTGWQDDIRSFLSISDVLVLPSYREGLSTTLLEAGGLGKPSITTDVTGCKDVIIDGFNGKIIDDPKTVGFDHIVKQLSDSMIYFLEAPDSQVAMLGKQAKDYVLKNYERTELWEAYKKLYSEFSNKD